ncbi:hypothetical protein GGI12_003732 [Dipsacomyces acuminosporus]|nr:hypothetical protein GGI12_003732 [Dipsacomyces acuminosporus]
MMLKNSIVFLAASVLVAVSASPEPAVQKPNTQVGLPLDSQVLVDDLVGNGAGIINGINPGSAFAPSRTPFTRPHRGGIVRRGKGGGRPGKPKAGKTKSDSTPKGGRSFAQIIVDLIGAVAESGVTSRGGMKII